MERVILNENNISGAKLLKEPIECTIVELKRWLECHRLQKGRGKYELVRRVIISNGVIKVDPKIDGGKWYEMKKGGTMQTLTSDYLPLSDFPDSGWQNVPSRNVPRTFNYGHVYHYLVESVNTAIMDICVDHEEEKNYEFLGDDTVTVKPLKKGRSLMDSGFVEDAQDN